MRFTRRKERNQARLYTKLVEVVGEIGNVEARGVHDFHGSSFIREGDLIPAVRNQLVARNVVMIPALVGVSPARPAKDGSKDTFVETATVAYTFFDGDTGAHLTVEWAGSGHDPVDGALRKALTSCHRTFLLKAFQVTSEDGRPSAPARTDGQETLNDEQYAGIKAAYNAGGQDAELLDQALDAQRAPTQVDGVDLTASQRVQMLTPLQAISVQRALVEGAKAVAA